MVMRRTRLVLFPVMNSFLSCVETVVAKKGGVPFATCDNGNGEAEAEYTSEGLRNEAGIIAHHLRNASSFATI